MGNYSTWTNDIPRMIDKATKAKKFQLKNKDRNNSSSAFRKGK
jgi:hypothetical protein